MLLIKNQITGIDRYSIESEEPLLTSHEDHQFNINNNIQIAERVVDVKGSSFAAYIHATCVVAGTGILGLPYALKQGGESRLDTYQDIGYHAYGKFGKYILVGIFNNAILVGVPILYFILAAQNFDALSDNLGLHLGFRVWTCICASLVAIPFILTKTLKEVLILSIFGSFATFFCVIVIVVLSFQDLSDVRNLPDPPSHDFVVFSQFPIALATISFSFGGNNVFPHIEENMEKPKNWNKVAIATMSTCALMYSLVAFSGYYVYGDLTTSPILNNLPKGLPLELALIFITIHVLLTAPIIMTSFAYDTEKSLKITTEYHSPLMEFFLRAGFRTCHLIISVIIAILVPFFGDFMSLLGAFANCLLVFVLPVVFYVRLFGWNSMTIWEMILNLFVILVGLIGCVVGTVDAISSLLKDFNEN
ncbi:9707_t:CDS:2 [Entrophospora sp. SA101]|nr:5444_t:CDS:2 [Entrophospora sp. SA101]CAJ0864830.1 9707_t:CDS:2 [Entrophospora sp. SA101]